MVNASGAAKNRLFWLAKSATFEKLFPLLIGKPIPIDYPLPSPAEGNEDDAMDGIGGIGDEGGAKKNVNQRRLNFTVEFCWRPHQTTEKPKTDSPAAPAEAGQQAAN